MVQLAGSVDPGVVSVASTLNSLAGLLDISIMHGWATTRIRGSQADVQTGRGGSL